MTQPEEFPPPAPPVNTINEYLVQRGANLPNHTSSTQGKGSWVRIGTTFTPSTFRTRQEAFRACAWILTLVALHDLPDEKVATEFPEVLEAIGEVEKANLGPLWTSFIDFLASPVDDEIDDE